MLYREKRYLYALQVGQIGSYKKICRMERELDALLRSQMDLKK